MSRLAIGLRQSTWVARPAGAMSRFVLLQTPPSTYSRPAICTGAKIQGTEQDACTASATLVAGEPGAPNTTRRPLARSTATTRRRPSKRAPALSTRSRIACQRRVAAGRAPEQRGAQRGAAVRAGGERHRRQRRRRGAGQAGRLSRATVCSTRARRAATAPPPATSRRRRRRPPTSPRRQLAPPVRRPGRRGRSPATSAAADERAGRRAHQRLRRAEVVAGGVLDAGQHAAHPGLAEHAAAGQHEHVGAQEGGVGHDFSVPPATRGPSRVGGGRRFAPETASPRV